mgnify:CR=1 FL=1
MKLGMHFVVVRAGLVIVEGFAVGKMEYVDRLAHQSPLRMT